MHGEHALRWIGTALAGVAVLVAASVAAAAPAATCGICGKNLIKNPGAEAGRGRSPRSVRTGWFPAGRTTAGQFGAASYTFPNGWFSKLSKGSPKRGQELLLRWHDDRGHVRQGNGRHADDQASGGRGRTQGDARWLARGTTAAAPTGNMTQVRADFADASGTVLARLRIGNDTTISGTDMAFRSRKGKVPAGATQVTIVVTFVGGEQLQARRRRRPLAGARLRSAVGSVAAGLPPAATLPTGTVGGHAHRHLERQLGQAASAAAPAVAGRAAAGCRLPAGDQARRRRLRRAARRGVADRGYELAPTARRSWNGVAILSRVGLDDVAPGSPARPGFPHPEARAVSATCGGVRVDSVYVPNGREPDSEHYRYKLAWLAALRDAVAAGPDATIVCGDMNIAPTDDDVFDPDAYVGQTHVTPPERRRWRSFRRSGCTTSCASAGRRSACSPTGTTAPECSIRTSACGSTSCWPAIRSPTASGRVGRPAGAQGHGAERSRTGDRRSRRGARRRHRAGGAAAVGSRHEARRQEAPAGAVRRVRELDVAILEARDDREGAAERLDVGAERRRAGRRRAVRASTPPAASRRAARRPAAACARA